MPTDVLHWKVRVPELIVGTRTSGRGKNRTTEPIVLKRGHVIDPEKDGISQSALGHLRRRGKVLPVIEKAPTASAPADPDEFVDAFDHLKARDLSKALVEGSIDPNAALEYEYARAKVRKTVLDALVAVLGREQVEAKFRDHTNGPWDWEELGAKTP